MIRKDYLMRILKQFFELLEKLIEMKTKKKYEEAQVFLNGIYESILNQPGEYYHQLNTQEILLSFKEEEREIKVEVLAELFYQDALLTPNEEVLQKSLELYEYLQAHSTTYSLNRVQRIEEIKDLSASKNRI